jgi:hypothetical protein
MLGQFCRALARMAEGERQLLLAAAQRMTIRQ